MRRRQILWSNQSGIYVKEEEERLGEPEVVDDDKETTPSRHKGRAMHMNSENLTAHERRYMYELRDYTSTTEPIHLWTHRHWNQHNRAIHIWTQENVAAYTRPAPLQNTHNPSMETRKRKRHKVPPLTRRLLSVSTCWQREKSVFSNRVSLGI